MIRTTTMCAALCAALPLNAQAPESRAVDLAICLDTSGSMSGLIDAARRNIWAIVNDLALAEPAPKLRVALLSFGNHGNDAARGWVRVDTPFTDDLDRVSQVLFGYTTNGGTEYVGRVVKTAVDELEWSEAPDALRMLVVAGNEGADQDPEVDFRDASAAAIARDILVNSIYCGDPADQLAPLWREVATRADGEFAAIDKDDGNVVIETPFDERLAALSARLNTTYVPYGAQWSVFHSNQAAQDRNAEAVDSATAAQRAVCKATSNYSCASWDLVDALRQQQVKLEDVKKENLPEALREMTTEQLRAHVDEQAKARAGIQTEVAELGAKRAAFVEEELKRRQESGDAAFEFAVRRAVRAQAEAAGFTFRATVRVATAEPEAPKAEEAR